MLLSELTSRTTFISQRTKRKFNINHKVDCKVEYFIYLKECRLSNKQYVRKPETAFNIRLNNHRKDTKNQNAIPACRDFKQQGHNFNCHAKFKLLDKLVNTFSSKEILHKCLIQRENFWIQKLKTLVL